jgi:hypothetical protein
MIKLRLWILAGIMLTVGACKKDLGPDVEPVNLHAQIVLDESISGPAFPLNKVSVTITNLSNNQKNVATADALGKVSFNALTPGNYDIQATLSITAAEYTAITGVFAENEIVFNGAQQSNITAQTGTLNINLIYGQLAKEWIIKQIYYAGSNTANGAIYRDQFLEFYNNSDHVLYADSLYFGQVYGINTARGSQDMSKPWFLPTGSFDWTKSIGMSNTKANDSYAYLKTLFRIPGTGKQYPVQPGTSIIIAQNAQNHQTPYTGTDGKTVSVKDPTLTIDLSKADFEVYLGNFPGINPLGSDVDNPAVTNVDAIINGGNRDLILDNPGREGIVIFKKSGNPTTWPAYPAPDQTSVTSTTTLYTQVPVADLMDAVELQQINPVSRSAKRIPLIGDAGATSVPGGSYSSQSSIRKTQTTVNGRRILKDTNNSTTDFSSLTKADPTKTVFAD